MEIDNSRNRTAKLSIDDVKEIKRRLRDAPEFESKRKLYEYVAEGFPINASYISQIANGRKWYNVKIDDDCPPDQQ